MPEMCGEIPNVIEESIFDVKEGILMAQSSIVNIGNAPQLPAYLAQPEGKGPFPAVVVIFEAFGLNENIKDITRRFAEAGYVALAPDLYYTEKERVVAYGQMEKVFALANTLPDDRAMADMGRALQYLKQQSKVKGNTIGVTGFCMGGRLAFLTACVHAADIAAAVPFYGGSIGGKGRFSGQTLAPLDLADKIRCPLIVNYGEKDAFIPMDEVRKVEARLNELGKQAEVTVYPGADHGYMCTDRASYHAEAAKDSWEKMIAFFGKHLR